MQYETLLSVLLGFAATVASAKFCEKLGSYDALCIKDDAVFMLSTSPCIHKSKLQEITLNIIYTKGTFQRTTIVTTEDITKPRSFGRKDAGIMLEMHHHSEGSKLGNMHVTLSLGRFRDNGVKSRLTVLDVYFYMDREGLCFEEFSGASFYPAPDCRISQRTGNFSTLCVSKKDVSIDKSAEGIFIVAMDPCSHPFSYSVIALFPTKNIEVVKRYTASKTDAFVAVENSTCGFKVKATPDHFKYPIAVSYGCSDSTAKQLINDYYFPEAGELCPPSSCSSLAPMHQNCSMKMISSNSKPKRISAHLKLKGCGEAWTADIALKMEGQANTLNLSFSQGTEFADFTFDGKKQKFTEHSMPEAVNGFIPDQGGHVSILVERLDHLDEGIKEHHVERVETPHLTYVILERHYGPENSSFHFMSPLFYAEVSLPPCASSRNMKSSLSVGVKVLISISVIAVIAAVIFLVYFRWRGSRNRLDGLPYQIELNYDELEKENL